MNRTHRIARRSAPSYFEHAARLKADNAVIYGPHLDVDARTPEGLRDPFKVARPFAHAMAQDTAEPFAWGWYDHPDGLRPAVCAVERVPLRMQVSGRTDSPAGADHA